MGTSTGNKCQCGYDKDYADMDAVCPECFQCRLGHQHLSSAGNGNCRICENMYVNDHIDAKYKGLNYHKDSIYDQGRNRKKQEYLKDWLKRFLSGKPRKFTEEYRKKREEVREIGERKWKKTFDQLEKVASKRQFIDLSSAQQSGSGRGASERFYSGFEKWKKCKYCPGRIYPENNSCSECMACADSGIHYRDCTTCRRHGTQRREQYFGRGVGGYEPPPKSEQASSRVVGEHGPAWTRWTNNMMRSGRESSIGSSVEGAQDNREHASRLQAHIDSTNAEYDRERAGRSSRSSRRGSNMSSGSGSSRGSNSFAGEKHFGGGVGGYKPPAQSKSGLSPRGVPSYNQWRLKSNIMGNRMNTIMEGSQSGGSPRGSRRESTGGSERKPAAEECNG